MYVSEAMYEMEINWSMFRSGKHIIRDLNVKSCFIVCGFFSPDLGASLIVFSLILAWSM